jgi:hypothetical protein
MIIFLTEQVLFLGTSVEFWSAACHACYWADQISILTEENNQVNHINVQNNPTFSMVQLLQEYQIFTMEVITPKHIKGNLFQFKENARMDRKNLQ